MKKILYTLSGTVTIQIIGIITGILVARILGVDGRGQLAAIITWVSCITYIGDLGLPVAYTYTSAREKIQIPYLISNTLLITPIQWAVLFLAGAVIIWNVLHQISREVAITAIIFLAAYIPLNLFTRYFNAIHQGCKNFGYFNIVRLSVPFGYLLTLFVFILIGLQSVHWIVSANIISNIFALALAILFTFMYFSKKIGKPQFDLHLLYKNIRYGLVAFFGNLQPFNSLRIDILILTMLVSTFDLGLYTVAISAATIIRAQGIALGMVVLPEVTATKDRIKTKRILIKFLIIILSLSGATAFIAFVWAKPLVIFVYGRDFAGSAKMVQILVLGAVAASGYRVLADGLRGIGQPGKATFAEIVNLLCGLICLFILIPQTGVNGAAYAVSFASLLALLTTIYFTRQELNGKIARSFDHKDIPEDIIINKC